MITVLSEYVDEPLLVQVLVSRHLDGDVVEVLLEEDLQLGLKILLHQLDQPTVPGVAGYLSNGHLSK